MIGSQVTRCALRSSGLPSKSVTRTPACGDHGQIAIGEKEKIAGVIEERGHIAGDKVFILAEADDGRWTIARGDDLVRIVNRDHYQREHAGEFLHRFAHGFFEEYLVMPFPA